MKTATDCPQPDELSQLLSGALSGERQLECISHLDTCACCQAKLEGIATEGTNISTVVEHLHAAEPMATSAYWPALKALHGESLQRETLHVETPPSGTPRATVKKRDDALTFLQPATDSAYLGRVAHFDVMRVVGRGGMGIVLEAFDSRLQRNVAIKMLDPDVADDDTARQRFCREARAAASITHENVVAVHQVEKAGDNLLPYLVMQLVTGESLEERLARGKQLPLREIVRIGMQAAHGLAAAHAQGLIHRDIKPGNILLESPHDRVKLTDFGLARVAEDVKLTRTGFVSGTPLYMAPEQAMGADSDHRSDLFSLGAVLYEMCAGKPPFEGNSALAILKQIAEAKQRPLREVNPQIPAWLATTIDRLLAKKPADRIDSAAQLAELLEFEWALMKTTSEDVPTVCKIEAARRAKRNRLIAIAVGLTFLGIGMLAGTFMAGRRAQPVAAASTAEPIAVLSANAGTVWSVSFSPDSKTVAMGVEDGTLRLWDLVTKTVKSAFNAHNGIVWSSGFSQNGEQLATSGDDGLIKIWSLPRPEPLKVFEHPGAVRAMVFSGDGQHLFAGDRGGGLRVWSLDSDRPLVEAQQPGSVYAAALSPNDETLATAGSDKIIRLWNAKTLTPKLSLEGHSGPINGLSFHPDGRRLASAGWDKTVRIWDVGSGLLIKSWKGHDGDIWSVAYSPDGAKLATGGLDGAVKLWDAETGKLLAIYLDHKLAVHRVTFNRDGTLLGSGGRDGAARVYKVE